MTSQTLTLRALPPNFRLFHGGHEPPTPGAASPELCFDEAVAWIAGEPHSAQPACMSRVLAAYGMRLNDRWTDAERQLLVPLLHRCVGTRGDAETERRRRYILVDAAIREIAPLGLAAVGWTDLADRLRAIAPVTDQAGARVAREITRAVHAEASKSRRDADAADDASAAYAYASAADDAAAAAAYASAADDAAAAAAAYAYASAADASASAAGSKARRPVVLASIAAFERAIDLRDASEVRS